MTCASFTGTCREEVVENSKLWAIRCKLPTCNSHRCRKDIYGELERNPIRMCVSTGEVFTVLNHSFIDEVFLQP